jgi:hypothetical protein
MRCLYQAEVSAVRCRPPGGRMPPWACVRWRSIGGTTHTREHRNSAGSLYRCAGFLGPGVGPGPRKCRFGKARGRKELPAGKVTRRKIVRRCRVFAFGLARSARGQAATGRRQALLSESSGLFRKCKSVVSGPCALGNPNQKEWIRIAARKDSIRVYGTFVTFVG